MVLVGCEINPLILSALKEFGTLKEFGFLARDRSLSSSLSGRIVEHKKSLRAAFEFSGPTVCVIDVL